MQFITLIVTIWLLPESRSKQEEEEAHVGMREIAATFTNPRLAPILWQKLALQLALYAWFSVIALYLKGQLGNGLVQTTEFFSAFAIVNVIINIFGVGRASEGLGDQRMSIVGLISLVVGFALVPFAHTILAVAGIMGLFALGMAFASNGITAQISNAFDCSRARHGPRRRFIARLALRHHRAPDFHRHLSGVRLTLCGRCVSSVMSAVSLLLGIRNISVQKPIEVEVEGTTIVEVEATT